MGVGFQRRVGGTLQRYAIPRWVHESNHLGGNDTLKRLRYWNEIAINTSGLDHTPVAPGESRVFGEQLGPGRSSRALASNLTGPDFTPPFPAYPSGHAGFGAALFQILRNFYRTDKIPFTFVSDEFNGVTLDNDGNVRPLLPRSFSTLSQAEEENGQSRIYLGIHWSFDKTEGIIQGRRVANFVFQKAFVRSGDGDDEKSDDDDGDDDGDDDKDDD
jgi:hypothetical protein